jgi:hypothetical protein
MNHLSKKFSMKTLYDLAYQWIDHKQQHGMDEAEANKLAPVILDFLRLSWSTGRRSFYTSRVTPKVRLRVS